MAKSRSIRWASWKASTASSYWKLWRAVTPRRNEGCAAGAPELGKRMGESARSARSANGPTAGMLAHSHVLAVIRGFRRPHACYLSYSFQDELKPLCPIGE